MNALTCVILKNIWTRQFCVYAMSFLFFQNELSSQTTNGATGGLERTFEDILAGAVVQKVRPH